MSSALTSWHAITGLKTDQVAARKALLACGCPEVLKPTEVARMVRQGTRRP